MSGTLFLLLATVLLAALLHAVRGLSASKVLESAVELLLVLALSGILYTALKTLFEMTRQAFLNLSVFLTSFLPVTASLYTMTGNTATAAAGTSMMLLFNTAVVALAERFLFPLLQVCFALSLVSAVPNGVSLQSIDRFRLRQLAGREYGKRTAPAVQRVRDAAGIRAITVLRRQHAEIRE